MEVKVQSIDRVFDIIELLSRSPEGLSLTEISVSLGLAKSTAFRLIASVIQRGYVEKTADGLKYHLGIALVDLCSMYLHSLELKTESLPYLRDLAGKTGKTTFLATRDGSEIVYIDRITQHSDLRKYSIIGQRVPAHATSLGKALMMDLSETEIRSLYPVPELTKLCDGTISNVDSLLANLAICRERGWSLDDQEAVPDIRCLGAPIRDYRGNIIAAVSVSWIIREEPEETGSRYAPLVMQTAAAISKRMGSSEG